MGTAGPFQAQHCPARTWWPSGAGALPSLFQVPIPYCVFFESDLARAVQVWYRGPFVQGLHLLGLLFLCFMFLLLVLSLSCPSFWNLHDIFFSVLLEKKKAGRDFYMLGQPMWRKN